MRRCLIRDKKNIIFCIDKFIFHSVKKKNIVEFIISTVESITKLYGI